MEQQRATRFKIDHLYIDLFTFAFEAKTHIPMGKVTQLRPFHTEWKWKRKRKISLMFAILIFALLNLFFDFFSHSLLLSLGANRPLKFNQKMIWISRIDFKIWCFRIVLVETEDWNHHSFITQTASLQLLLRNKRKWWSNRRNNGTSGNCEWSQNNFLGARSKSKSSPACQFAVHYLHGYISVCILVSWKVWSQMIKLSSFKKK